MATVIISQVAHEPASGAWFIKGTVDGATHLMLWKKPFSPTEVSATALAQAFLDEYAKLDQILTYGVISKTVTLSAPVSAARQVAVVFGNKSTIYSVVGYGQIQITGTVGGTTFYTIIQTDELKALAFSGADVARVLAARIAAASNIEADWLSAHTATFTLTSSTSSSTTTTTTTTTT